MKKRFFVFLLAFTLWCTQASARLSPVDLEAEIAVLAHYSWDYTVGEAQAYFTAAGYSVHFGIMFGGDRIEGTKKAAGETLTLSSLGSKDALGFLSLEVPASTSRTDVLAAVMQAFGETHSSHSDFWILEGGSALSLTDVGETPVKLTMISSDNASESTPLRTGSFSPEALQLAESAMAAAQNSASTAQSDAAASSEEGTRNPSEPFSFKNGIVFGMNQAEVVAVESAVPADQDKDTLLYSPVSVQGLDAHLGYLFESGKLFAIMYLIQEPHGDPGLYITDYEKLQKMLTAKYGKPSIYQEGWNSDMFKDTKELYGFALATGDLNYHTYWMLHDVQIGHTLDGDDNEIKHLLVYSTPSVTWDFSANDTGDI